MFVLYFASPRHGLAAVVAAAVVISLTSLVALNHGWWMPPAGTLAAILIAYPLWSWRRLESVIAGLIEQSHSLEAEPEVLAFVEDGTVDRKRPRHPALRGAASLNPRAVAAAKRRPSGDGGRSASRLDAASSSRCWRGFARRKSP